jgi:predicted  nucleic acid-binding Zn-ribbon protein
MSEYNPHVPSDSTESDSIDASLQRLSRKVQLIAEAVKALHQDRSQLETKIEDAQKRIQHILSRLPEQSDGRQLNLLGEPVPPTNPEDDNEPTTH